MFRENELSIFGKTAVSVLILLAACSAVFNVYRGVVPSPSYFAITLFGFCLFLFAKISVISKGIKFSFGTAQMSGSMANIYRLGYWLMIFGVLCTFVG